MHKSGDQRKRIKRLDLPNLVVICESTHFVTVHSTSVFECLPLRCLFSCFSIRGVQPAGFVFNLFKMLYYPIELHKSLTHLVDKAG